MIAVFAGLLVGFFIGVGVFVFLMNRAPLLWK